jgi:hypothetical protein
MIAADNEAGAKEVSIHDNTVGANSQVGAGQCHGIIMGSGASRFRIKDNRSGSLVVGGATQGYGVFIMGGNSSEYQVTGNSLGGNLYGGVLNGAPHPTGMVKDNN